MKREANITPPVDQLPIWQIDTFTHHLFAGNPAAVVLLQQPLPDALMQAIAAENNLSETAFVLPRPVAAEADIRWFTPTTEVGLCGHATLAAAHVLFSLQTTSKVLTFHTARGSFIVEQQNDARICMQFPEDLPQPWQPPAWLADALGTEILDGARGIDDVLVEVHDEATLSALQPNMSAIARIDARGLIVTARGHATTDFISRFFAPQSGIPEDPVTGSAHTLLTPYWATRLQRHVLHARQCSSRGGEVDCHWQSPRVQLIGQAVSWLQGHIRLPIGTDF